QSGLEFLESEYQSDGRLRQVPVRPGEQVGELEIGRLVDNAPVLRANKDPLPCVVVRSRTVHVGKLGLIHAAVNRLDAIEIRNAGIKRERTDAREQEWFPFPGLKRCEDISAGVLADAGVEVIEKRRRFEFLRVEDAAVIKFQRAPGAETHAA